VVSTSNGLDRPLGDQEQRYVEILADL